MDAMQLISPLIAVVALVVALVNRKGDRNQQDSHWRGKIQQEVDTLNKDNNYIEEETRKIMSKQAQYGSEIKTLFEKNREQDEKIFHYSTEIKSDLRSLESKVESIRSEIKSDVEMIVNILKKNEQN